MLDRARVLVVDDDPHVRAVVRAILETADYEIDDVESGALAMSRVPQWQPHIVLTDLVMPDQEGMALIRMLRQAHPSLGIIAMSGARGGAYLPIAKTMGADATLAKPFNSAALISQVRDVLRIRETAA